MARFGKNVLSQFLRTKCDKQLRLSLYSDPELTAMNWPVRLEARPAVQILRDRGKEWEQAKMQDLESAFGNRLLGTKQDGKFIRTELRPRLEANPTSPTIVVQPRFSHENLRTSFLQNIGMTQAQIDLIPEFTAFEPDVIVIKTAADDDVEIMPDGERVPIQAGEQRKALLVSDIKHAGEANSSYSSEVTLYAVLLSNWLELTGLNTDYFVANRLGLWTRAKEVSELARLLAANPGSTVTERLTAFLFDLESVDFQIFFQTIEHFFKQDLPRVLAIPDWTGLDWHVDSRCSTCDFLGHRNWLRAADRTRLDANRPWYCVPAAEDSGHLSRLATITRGSRKTLHLAGHTDVTAVSTVTLTDPVFDQHNGLKADRNHLPHRAAALLTGAASISQNTTTVDFPRYADLQVFLTVNFDPGTGLLCAIGSEARFRRRVPFGQPQATPRVWQNEAHTMLTATIAEERNVVISFLSRLADVFAFVHDTDPEKGGADAAKTRIQVYFWDRRQFEELAKAIGRHLNSIVLPQTEHYLRGLVWLFPPEEVLEEEEITLANPITFVKTVIQRDLRLPVAHCLTLFNVAEVYHNDGYATPIPTSFLRDPFSDMIPRERIYEIWSQEPLVQIGTVQRTRSQCISDYSDAVKKQVGALRSIVWKFGADMGERLTLSARPLSIGLPFNFQRMSEDGRLWYGWARLEEACDYVELQRMWSAEPEELEANYSILRLANLVSTEANGDLVYEVLPSSRDCKFRDNESFLGLQDEAIPGFLDLRVRDLLSHQDLQGVNFDDRNKKLARVFGAELIDFDRANLRARVRLTTFGNAANIRTYLIQHGDVDLSAEVSLIAGPGVAMADRVRDCLIEIGRPPISQAAAATYAALGHAPGTNPPRNDAVTSAARILWDAAALAVEQTELTTPVINEAIDAIAAANWPLNLSQRTAIAHCLSHRLSIVWGPPGTGKTTTAASLIVSRIIAAQDSGENIRILVTGPTYTAWEKLFGEVIELLELVQAENVACYRVYSGSHGDRALLPDSTNEITDVEARSADAGFQALWGQLQTPQSVILVGAVAQQCYRIAKQGNDTAMAEVFDFLVIDESSQLDVAKSLYPLCLLSATPEVALFGDHLQMPPVITTQPPRGAEWLVGSIQNYLRERHSIPLQNLLTNYRSAQSFVDFGKGIGYPLQLTAHSEDLQLHQLVAGNNTPANWNTLVPWFGGISDILNVERRLVAVTYADGRAGQANEFEADLVCSVAQNLFLKFSQSLAGEKDSTGQVIVPAHTAFDANTFWDRGVGIVTPHRAQRALIVRRLRQIFPAHDAQRIDAAVDTVERFQGGQRDTILISFGVGDPDLIADEENFLLQLQRTNVAISRARAKCILFISEDLAFHLPSDRETIQTSKAVKAYVSDFCRETTAIQVPTGNAQRAVTVRWHES